MEHFSKFRDVIVKKWPAFVPLPQVSLQIIGKTNLSNDIKKDILNSFIKEIVQYDFFTDSPEFRCVFSSDRDHISVNEIDQYTKQLMKELKKEDSFKAMLSRYQKQYYIDISSISTYHLQTCRDFIVRFQRILNKQMKVLLKLVFRFEKQIN